MAIRSKIDSVQDTFSRLRALMAERILVIDGAMGTMLQAYQFQERTSAGSASRTTRRT